MVVLNFTFYIAGVECRNWKNQKNEMQTLRFFINISSVRTLSREELNRRSYTIYKHLNDPKNRIKIDDALSKIQANQQRQATHPFDLLPNEEHFDAEQNTHSEQTAFLTNHPLSHDEIVPSQVSLKKKFKLFQWQYQYLFIMFFRKEFFRVEGIIGTHIPALRAEITPGRYLLVVCARKHSLVFGLTNMETERFIILYELVMHVILLHRDTSTILVRQYAIFLISKQIIIECIVHDMGLTTFDKIRTNEQKFHLFVIFFTSFFICSRKSRTIS